MGRCVIEVSMGHFQSWGRVWAEALQKVDFSQGLAPHLKPEIPNNIAFNFLWFNLRCR